MADATLNRFEWLKALLQDSDVSHGAARIATAIAVVFANDETGQINPSQETVADYVKMHRDTVKRLMRELRNAGWLMSIGDGGRGKAPRLRLLSPSNVVRFNPLKGGTNKPPQEKKRGDDLSGKGGRINPSHKRKEQSLEQRGAQKRGQPCFAVERFAGHRFTGNATDGPRLVLSTDHASLYAWDDWLSLHGYPKQCHLPIRQDAEKGNAFGFHLPSKRPPTTPEAEAEAKWYFETLMDSEAATHAAQ